MPAWYPITSVVLVLAVYLGQRAWLRRRVEAQGFLLRERLKDRGWGLVVFVVLMLGVVVPAWAGWLG